MAVTQKSIGQWTAATAWAAADCVAIAQNIATSEISRKITQTNFFAGIVVPIVVTSASATALVVGRQGATAPAFLVNAATGSSATGIKITSAAAAGGVALAAISSGANESMTIDAKGSGNINMQLTATGGVGIGIACGTTEKVNIAFATVATGSNRTLRVQCPTRTVSVDESNFISGIAVNGIGAGTYAIESGKTDSGTRYGVRIDNYVNNADFAGTLAAQYGIYCRLGIAVGSGTITDAFGIYIDHAAASGTMTNAWGVYQATSGVRNFFAGSVGIGSTTFGTSATRTLCVATGTAPSSSPADCFQMYSKDQAAGNAVPHFRTEGGKELKLYQQAHIADAGAGTEITTINAILVVLENMGLLATS